MSKHAVMHNPENGAMEKAALSPSQLSILIPVCLSFAVLILWLFPSFWYNRTDSNKDYFWLAEQTELAGWRYQTALVSQAAEKVLVADRLVSGNFLLSSDQSVQVFSAKRYTENPNDIGLFVHTPDRCWTEAGWKIEPVSPDVVRVDVHGATLVFERRLFKFHDERQLVYFTGLAGGQPLPYRLDHNLGVASRSQLEKAAAASGALLRISDTRLWTHVWNSFISRRPLLGPKQFIRLSTPVQGDNLADADELLQEFIPLWLKPTNFKTELDSWKRDN